MTGLQCARRLWWETHERKAPELERTASERAIMQRGTYVGEVARSHVPGGVSIDQTHGQRAARAHATRKAIDAGAGVLYEASFFQDSIFIAADILALESDGWTLSEVKSTTKVKLEHLPDAAIQTHVMRTAGLKVKRIEIMHLNRECRYPDLSNLFYREDVTREVNGLVPLVAKKAQQQLVMLSGSLPEVKPSEHCFKPYTCPFTSRCWSPRPKHHVGSLYRMRRKKALELESLGYTRIYHLPEDMALGTIAERQRRAVRSRRIIVEPGLAEALNALVEPVAYLDFESVGLAIPVWTGCRPYDAIPVQLSCHVESPGGRLKHHQWIANGPEDPREEIARALLKAVRGAASIAVYNISFERQCIEHLRDNVSELAAELDDVIARLVDVLPMVRNYVYHPNFVGSFSLKSVYPALLRRKGRGGYAGLDVSDGLTASFQLERLMFHQESRSDRREIKRELLKYCAMDTHALAGLVGRLRQLAVS